MIPDIDSLNLITATVYLQRLGVHLYISHFLWRGNNVSSANWKDLSLPFRPGAKETLPAFATTSGKKTLLS